MKKCLLLLLALALSCNKKETTTTVTTTTVVDTTDDHTFSKPGEAVVTHLDLDIAVDFDSRTISGKAGWTIDNKSKGNEIIFDENTLEITKVTLGAAETETETAFTLGEPVEFHGKPLKIKIDANTTKVNIYYRTTKDAVALQWLNPAQTADKNHPFLFTQGESIWSRTWIPCQDSPGIRFTYNAKVSVPKDLIALMSAENPQQKNTTGVYTFTQGHPIPSYLMALAVGDLEFKAIDARTGVYAEPSIVKDAAWEFADMGKMVGAAEELYGPYRWGRFDVLVLPPSFPYGGMENPNLTFLTPGMIAGDRSMVGILAHELGHSWSGNLVTNATWDDVWLNEGFTTYVEQRIGESIFGKGEAAMQAVLSRKVLENNLADYGPNNHSTRLKVDTKGKNADESLSNIPYEKGLAFLQTVESIVGRQKFDAFVRGYFDHFAFQSLSTETFLKYFNEKLIAGDKALADKIQAEAWIYQPDVPANMLKISSDDFKRIDEIQASWRKAGTKALSVKIRSTNEKLHFIDNLPTDLNAEEMAALDTEFHFTDKGNYIVKRQWFVQAIKHQYKAAYPAIEKFMMGTSRTGSLELLYKEMVKTAEGKRWARNIFEKAKVGYHATTVQDLKKIIN